MVPPRDSALRGPGVRVLLAGTARHVTGSVLPEIPAVGDTVGDLASTLVERCELSPANLRTVVDPADPAVLGQALVDATSDAERLLLFYFVGHGLVSSGGELHLATSATRDLTRGLATYQALPYSKVRTALTDCRAQSIVVVLDCCYSGRARGSLGSAVDDAFTASHVRGGYLLTSAARNELALAVPGERHTVFTGALLDLLHHGDPTDKTAPPRLTLDYLHRRLERRLVEHGFPRPYRQASDRAGELVLADNPAWTPSKPRLDRSEQAQDGAESAICPYPGLEPFDREDAGWFFGRERLTQELLTLVTAGTGPVTTGPVIVVGPSGSGKSSLLRAGLLASLASNGPQLLFTPAAHPVRELATRLAQHSCTELDGNVDADRIRSLAREVLGESPLLLVVDQFEELFTACSDELERGAFVAALASLSTPEEGSVEPLAVVVLGMRADFYGHLAAYPLLVEALRIRQLVVGPMSSDEVRSAIEKPAETVGLALEQGLVDLVLRDLGSVNSPSTDASPLPFLSHALRATWERREGRLLTLTGYQATGGIWDAVRSTADATYDGLDPDDQETARRLLLRMVRIGEGTEHTRRRLVVDELEEPALTPSSSIARVLRRLADARLVTVDKDTEDDEVPVTAEISHEALIRGWPRLTSWIEADRADLVTRQQLSEAAEAWQRAGQDASMLYQGLRLTSARQLVERPRRGGLTPVELTPVERSFLNSSEQRARRTTRRLHQTVAILATSLLLAVTAGGVAVYQWRAAVQEQRNAVAQQLAAQAHAVLSAQPWVSMMLDAQSLQFMPTQQARADLVSALLTQPRRVATLKSDSSKFRQIAFHPRRPLLLTQDEYGTTKLWDTASRAVVATMAGVGGSVKFSPDGRLLVTVGGKSAVLWNLDDPMRPKQVAVLPDAEGEGETWAVGFAANGQSLAVVHKGDRTVLWDVRDPALPRWLSSVATRGPDQDYLELSEGVAVFSPDGRTLATGSGGTTVLWDVNDLTAPHQLMTVKMGDVEDDGNLAFSSDGRMLAIAGSNQRSMLGAEGQTHILDVAGLVTEIQVNQSLKARYGQLGIWDDPYWDTYLTRRHRVNTLSTPGIIGNLRGTKIVFSPTDPKIIATAPSDGRTYLWDLADPARPRRIAVLTGGVIDATSHNATFHTAVAFSPDGRTLATINSGGVEGDTALSLWELGWAQSNKIATIPGSVGRATAVSPDGKTLATVEENGMAILWDISDPARPARLTIVPSSDVTALAFSHSGDTLITGGSRSSTLWDVRSPAQPVRRTELAASATAVAFNPTGEMVATAGSKLTLWDTQTGTEHKFSRLLINELYEASDAALAFNSKWNVLATVDNNRMLVWIYADNPAVRSSVANRSLTGGTDTGANNALFSPNGETLLTITGDQAVLWDARIPTNPTRLAELEPVTQLNAAAFGPDGNLLATSGVASTTLWNIAQLNQPAPVAAIPSGVGVRTGPSNAITFVPGKQIVAIATAQGVELWSTAYVAELASASTEQLVAQACSIAGPGLSEQDWNAYLPDLTHHQICP